MAHLLLTSPCYVCGKQFTSNPELVPSVGNQPICKRCVEEINEVRRRKELPEWTIPEGAYEPQELGGPR